jgi:hypothetical protein
MRKVATIGRFTTAAAIAPAAAILEPMAAPAVPVTPAGPWAHSQKNTVIEVSWSVKSIRRAGIRRIVVIPVLANRLNADAHANYNLCLSRWRQGHARDQCRCTDHRFESTHK